MKSKKTTQSGKDKAMRKQHGEHSHFLAYLARMQFIRRWSLMRNTSTENIQEHSAQVAMIAHTLALIKNEMYGGRVNPERVTLLALYHDVTEVITGDLPRPVKYFNTAIRGEYAAIEAFAAERLLEMLPPGFTTHYRPLLIPDKKDSDAWQLVKYADQICNYLKCIAEIKAGNREFSKAAKTAKTALAKIKSPEIRYFVRTFIPSFSLTLDELN